MKYSSSSKRCRKLWTLKSKVTRSTSANGTVGYEYSLDFEGEEPDFEVYQEKLFKLQQLTMKSADKALMQKELREVE